MTDFKLRSTVDDTLLRLNGGDPFAHVAEAADLHRLEHLPKCGLFPAGPQVMRLAATWVRAANAKRILDLGTGFGYSALWLARAAGPDARVDAIDRFADHLSVAQSFAEEAHLAKQITFLPGNAADVLNGLSGPYDFIHDDAWFAHEPAYYERLLELLKVNGIWSTPNWFLLEDAITKKPARDWSEFAGPNWAEATMAYAKKIAADRRLAVTWSVSPPLAIAVKLGCRT